MDNQALFTWIQTLAFIGLGALVLLGACLVLFFKELVHQILAMLMMFFSAAGIMVLLKAEFIAAILLIVYAGAILVLFLFAMMLFSPKMDHTPNSLVRKGVIGLILVVFVAVFSMSFRSLMTHQDDVITAFSLKEFAMVLFSKYLVPFEVASIMLLVGMIGALVIASKELPMQSGSEDENHSK